MGMTPFYASPEKLADLTKTLAAWDGTPYRHWCGVKQSGTDCIHFVARVLEETGYPKRFEIPRYPPDWHKHNTEELLLDGIRSQADHIEIDPYSPKNGDIIAIRFGKVSSHAAFFLDKHLFHAINGIGVIREHWLERKWYPRFSYGFRLLA